MARTTTDFGQCPTFFSYAAGDVERADLPRHKLERLRELRAVIDTLRCERESRDPLLNWVVGRNTVENQRRD